MLLAGTTVTLASTVSAKVEGVVIDSITGQPVPYAAVFLHGSDRGAIANDDGHFSITTERPYRAIGVTAMGYRPVELPGGSGSQTGLTVKLIPEGVKLTEITIRPGKEHYSKKNNPAVEMMRKIRARQDLTDPCRNPFYNFDKYERISIGLNNFDVSDQTEGKGGGWMLRQFPVLRQYVDTSEISGHPVLNLAVREKASTVHNRAMPRTTKEVIAGLQQSGMDDMLDPQSLRLFYEDVMREIDVYANDINLLQNRFVSPLSRIAPDFYKFYLTDTVDIGGERCVELTFVPHNDRTFGFTGRFYVLEGDSTMFIKRILLNVPRNINLNFIDRLFVVQDYKKGPDGSRLKQRDDMIIEASLIPGTQGLYARRNTAYTNHSFNQPADSSIFGDMRSAITAKDASRRDSTFWSGRRPDSRNDYARVSEMMVSLRRIPVFYWTEKVIKVLVTGYIPTARKSKFDLGPMNTTLSFNSVEGVRLRAGGITTANLSKRWFTRAYVAYGTRDHRWKYSGELEYSFRDKEYHSREFPIHSIRATHLYDVDMIGQHYLFTNPDNMFLSLKRTEDHLMTYHRETKLEYTLELENNFSVVAGMHNDRQESTPFMPFTDGLGRHHSHFTMTSLNLTLRYAPGEKFYQSKTNRYPINLDAPVVMLTHIFAPAGLGGNGFSYNKTELSLQKRFWFSAFGYTDIILKGGHIWGHSQYPYLLIPNANLSYTIQPESFALMAPMEFMNDSYVSVDFTYWANGAILNYIPLVKRLKLREAFSFRGVWGSLSSRNNPAGNPGLFRFPALAKAIPMGDTPYMEAAVGIDNLFKILRVDYVWRLTYRDVRNADKRGVRIALHFTF